jgi:hypothetical protein
MLRTLDDPRRLARTYALVIPGWLARKFNEIAMFRDYVELPPPSEDIATAFKEGGDKVVGGVRIADKLEATPQPPRAEPALRPAAQAGVVET